MWHALFIIGYLLSSIGAGIILFQPVKNVMGTIPATRHEDMEEDEIWSAIIVSVGVGAMWPVTIPAYYISRNQVVSS
jgi:hypothetical protein